jgi:hypothetical protein
MGGIFDMLIGSWQKVANHIEFTFQKFRHFLLRFLFLKTPFFPFLAALSRNFLFIV